MEQELESVDPAADDSVWVVGVDGSKEARHAALWAAEHAAGRADRIEIVNAWSFPSLSTLPPIGPIGQQWDTTTFETAARECVERLQNEMRPGLTVPVEAVVTEGQSASVLIRASRHASLLVLGSRGQGGFARLMLGSTSTQCATHAEAPTAVIPATSEIGPTKRIVVAVDGSETSLDAVRWAAEFATTGSVIDCVSVWDVTPIAVGSDQFFFPEASDLAQERFEHQINTLIDELGIGTARDVTVQRTFVEGQARRALADVASEADLLVMGARGHGAIGAALLGSVSTWLLHHVTRPMIVIPHRPANDEVDETDAKQQ